MKRILTLICARSGSKGLRHKNLRSFHGRPLLAHAIDKALRARRTGEVWRVVVSTDSRRYAAVARQAGAEVPFLRPKRLAADDSRLADAVLHALDELGDAFDAVMLVGVTTPLVSSADLRAALRAFFDSGLSVASVALDRVADSWRFGLRDGRLTGEPRAVGRRQQSRTRVALVGGVYVASPAWLRRHRQFVVAGKTHALLLPRARAIDIEDELDLALAALVNARFRRRINRAPKSF